MARLVLTAVGAIVGGYFGYPQLGAALGSLAGAALVREKVSGPKLEDLSSPKLTYGSPWPRVYGVYRVTGIPIWASDLRAVESTEGGKGGGPEITTTSYRMDMLLGLTIDSDVVSYSRIWFNKKLVYNVGPNATSENIANSVSQQIWSGIDFFNGDPAQLPWDVYEAVVGIGNAPAYRHRATIGFTNLDVGSAGQPPLIEVEIFTSGTQAGSSYIDNFGDGLTPYAGDLIRFEGDTDDYGPFIYGLAAGVGAGTFSISRTIAVDSPQRMSVRFRYSSIGTDDTTIFSLLEGASARFGVIAVREENFDALRRPYVALQGESIPVFASQLDLFQWYRAEVNIVSGAGNSYVNLYLGDTLINTENFVGNFTPQDVDTIQFRVEAGGAESAGSGQFAQLHLTGAGAAINPVDLGDIFTAECDRVGLTSSQIDVTDLVGTDVTGFATASAARPTLEQLAGIFYLECFSNGTQVEFRSRGGSSAATIAHDDTGAGVNSPGTGFLGMDRADDLSVPAFYAVSLPDYSRDYEPLSVMSDRLVGNSSEVRQIQAAVVMTPDQAKGRADSYARDARIASHTGEVSLDIYHIQRTPTDVITVTDKDGNTYRSRIVRQTFADMVLKCEIVLDDLNALRETGTAPAAGTPATDVPIPGITVLNLIDGPILRDADDDAGLYGATRIGSGTGVGSRVFKSVDGTTYLSVGDVMSQAISGLASTALGTVTNPYVWDEVNTVTVNVSDTLSSSTTAAMQADATINLLAVRSGSGWEYLRFRTATLVTTGIYTLSGLIRGLRGTEEFITGHAIGDTVVLLRTTGMIRIPGTSTEINQLRYYKGVTLGQAVASVSAIELTNQAVGLKPFSPLRLRAERDTSGNITFTWNRRTRMEVRYGGSGGTLAPLGEDTEAYQLDIYDGVNVVRTISATSETASYTAAQQTTDFGAPVSAGSLDAEVFQISATVGRGTGHRRATL